MLRLTETIMFHPPFPRKKRNLHTTDFTSFYRTTTLFFMVMRFDFFFRKIPSYFWEEPLFLISGQRPLEFIAFLNVSGECKSSFSFYFSETKKLLVVFSPWKCMHLACVLISRIYCRGGEERKERALFEFGILVFLTMRTLRTSSLKFDISDRVTVQWECSGRL